MGTHLSSINVLTSVYPCAIVLARDSKEATVIKKTEDAKYARIQLVIPKDVLARVRRQAEKERRNTSNMITVLVEKALREAENEPGPMVLAEMAA